MKVVIIGAGASGLLHALAFRSAGLSVEGIYDPDASRAQSLCELAGGHVFASFDEAAHADAEVAAVCSPPALHVAQAETLARGGRTVFVEKPVATTHEELMHLRRFSNCVPIVQWRAGRGLRALRRAIAHGELGAAPIVGCDLAWGRDEAYFRSRGESWGCGALLSIGIHAVDAILWAIGKRVAGISGMLSKRRDSGGETAAAALVSFAGGALVSLRISLEGGADSTRINACGRGVSVALVGSEADPTGSTLEWRALDEPTRARLEALERSTEGALGPLLLVPYLGAAIDALRNGMRPGECESLPSIADVADAHTAIFGIYGGARAARAA